MNADRQQELQKHARDAFSALRRTNAYTTAPACLKRQIIAEVWQESADSLMKEFNEEGICEDGPVLSRGFGYFVEAFTKRSQNVPRNTTAAQRVSDVLLAELRTGDGGLTTLAKRLKNPDHLFLDCTGRRIKLWGMGEVKASSVAHLKNKNQLSLQEKSVRTLVELVNKEKRKASAHGFFAKRELTIADPFQKFMIIPAGEDQKMRKVLPADWHIIQLEFSYYELLFLAQCLWPQFRTNVEFAGNDLCAMEDGFFQELLGWWARQLGDDYPVEVHKDLLFFACSTGRCPVDDHDIAFVQSIMSTTAMHDAWEDIGDVGACLKEPTLWEMKFMKKFRDLLRADKNQIHLFLAHIRLLLPGIAPILNTARDRIHAMPNVSVLS